MKELFPIKVDCHSGFKADEYPKSFYFDNFRFDVEEIIDRWYQVSSPSVTMNPTHGFTPASYFKVRTSDQKIYILKHETETNHWFVWIKGESMNLNQTI